MVGAGRNFKERGDPVTQIPTTEAAAAMIIQLDLAISERLVDDPQALALFDAYNNLLDSLCAGLSDESPHVCHNELVRARLERAQTALAGLGVMGRSLPDADAS